MSNRYVAPVARSIHKRSPEESMVLKEHDGCILGGVGCHFIRVREARSDTCPAVASYCRLYGVDMGQ